MILSPYRYLVFAYPAYYPGGGWTDFKDAFRDQKAALEYADGLEPKYDGAVEVIDLDTGEDIYFYKHQRGNISRSGRDGL